jgi:hypothetical protein
LSRQPLPGKHIPYADCIAVAHANNDGNALGNTISDDQADWDTQNYSDSASDSNAAVALKAYEIS